MIDSPAGGSKSPKHSREMMWKRASQVLVTTTFVLVVATFWLMLTNSTDSRRHARMWTEYTLLKVELGRLDESEAESRRKLARFGGPVIVVGDNPDPAEHLEWHRARLKSDRPRMLSNAQARLAAFESLRRPSHGDRDLLSRLMDIEQLASGDLAAVDRLFLAYEQGDMVRVRVLRDEISKRNRDAQQRIGYLKAGAWHELRSDLDRTEARGPFLRVAGICWALSESLLIVALYLLGRAMTTTPPSQDRKLPNAAA